MPVKPITTVRNAAPARMKAIMHEVRVAPISPSTKVALVSVPENHDSTSESSTPTDAASVGEAMPK